MVLDSVLIKKQAKQIMKGKILNLFIISIVVVILTSGATIAQSAYDAYNRVKGNSTGYSDFYDFGSSNSSGSKSWDSGYFDNFNGKFELLSIKGINDEKFFSILINILKIVCIIFTPLSISICGLYLLIIRGKHNLKLSDYFGYTFTSAFNVNYWKKFLLVLLESLIIVFMMLFFIVPGIIFYYKYYFAFTIMADKPNLSPMQALKLSKKLTKGYKTELFLLDLSFIGWFLLSIITCGIAFIYVIPYYDTVRALYYENFRIRAYTEGSVSAYDFMTPEEKMNTLKDQVFGTNTQNNATDQTTTYYQPPQNDFGSGMDNDYYNNIF